MLFVYWRCNMFIIRMKKIACGGKHPFINRKNIEINYGSFRKLPQNNKVLIVLNINVINC
jgi:hypothetical protein